MLQAFQPRGKHEELFRSCSPSTRHVPKRSKRADNSRKSGLQFHSCSTELLNHAPIVVGVSLSPIRKLRRGPTQTEGLSGLQDHEVDCHAGSRKGAAGATCMEQQQQQQPRKAPRHACQAAGTSHLNGYLSNLFLFRDWLRPAVAATTIRRACKRAPLPSTSTHAWASITTQFDQHARTCTHSAHRQEN